MTKRDGVGRYDFTDMDALCTCGHKLAVHAAATPRPCFNDTGLPGGTDDPCDCERFRNKP